MAMMRGMFALKFARADSLSLALQRRFHGIRRRGGAAWLAVGLAGWLPGAAQAGPADQPQFGHAWTRNFASGERGLPDTFDPKNGTNVRWSVPLGTETHATPVIAGGRIYIGTNNGEPRDPKHQGDRGVLMCLAESDGHLLWQLVVPKRVEDIYFDWPNSGICSPATVEGDRIYIVSNRGEVMCLDALGLANGNDGPFQDEGRHMTPAPQPALEPGPLDADIIWLFNLTEGAGIWSHDAAHSSVLIRGDHLYLNSGTGVDNTHRKIRTPDAPSLVVLDKRTGRLLARDDEHIAPYIFHNTWAAPSMAKVNGRELIFFNGGNGVVYAFEPLAAAPPEGQVAKLRKVWQFDCDPTAPKENVHRYNQNRGESPSDIFGMPVVIGNQVFVAGGGDIWWGKNEAWLQCIDATGEGDITRTAQRWRYPLVRHVMATPTVADGLVFIGDVGQTIHCVDAATGKAVWTHEASGEIWASACVADGKAYFATRRGQVVILAAAREKQVLATIDLVTPISGTPVAANGTLYLTTMNRLFALARAPK